MDPQSEGYDRGRVGGTESVSYTHLFERFDITSLISGVLQSLDILIEQKEAQVIFRHKNPVYVWADEFKVEQVVRNYVNNALNHIAVSYTHLDVYKRQQFVFM